MTQAEPAPGDAGRAPGPVRQGGAGDGGTARDGAPRRPALVDHRAIHVSCSPSQAFAPIRRIGGSTGWYYGNWLWRLRGLVDVMLGGCGMRPGRRDDDELLPGDPVDCWEVESVETDRRLRLAATMKLPGQAWLQFGVEADADGSTIWQKATFLPRGPAGLAYWYALYPIHMVMFSGMLRAIAGACRGAQSAQESGAAGSR